MSTEATDVWVYLQYSKGELTQDSLEVIAAGRKVADKLKQKVVGVVIGYKVEQFAKEALAFGADRVVYVDAPEYDTYLNLRYIDAIHEMVAEKRPYAFLFVANELGKDLAARIAYRVGTGLATDNVQLEVEDYTNPALGSFKDLLIQIRPDFGTRLARIYTPRHRPQMATIRPGNFAPLKRDASAKGTLERFTPVSKDYPASVKGVEEVPPPKMDLRGAKVVISLGLGILTDGAGKARDPREAYQLALKLKDALEKRYGAKTEIGATRALIYAELKELDGLISKSNQVGQTGTTVSPLLYFAVGISGALQHRVGMRGSHKIVAINNDPGAPIFKIAHYPIIGDLYEEIPKLISRLGGDNA